MVTPAGTFPFQEWFVGRGHRDEVDAVVYEGAGEARAAPGVVDAIAEADAILLAPSNPYLSIGPIVAVGEIRVGDRAPTRVAASPSARSSEEPQSPARPPVCSARMAGGATPAHVADRYEGLIDALVIDESDAPADGAGRARRRRGR